MQYDPEEYARTRDRQLAYLQGAEFKEWADRNLGERKEGHLQAALKLARNPTPDNCFLAVHELRMYAAVWDMMEGDKARINLEKTAIEMNAKILEN